MGACSSKPRTKESDASMEPQKPAEFAANQQKHGERSLDKVANDRGKDALIKLGEEGEAAQLGIVQTAPGLDGSNDKQASKPLISSLKEDISELPSDVPVAKEPICKAVSDGIQQNERDLEEVSDGTVKKHDGDGATIVDNSSKNEGKEVSLADEAKTCEDKAVVSEEAGGNQEDGAYTDKKIALDEGNSTGAPGQRKPAVTGAKPMDSTECDSFELPIVGAAQPVEPKINGVDTGNTKNVVADEGMEAAREGTCKDTRAVAENPDARAGNVGVDVKRSDDLGQHLLESGGEVFAVRMPPPASPSESLGPLDEAVLPKDSQDERASKSQEAVLSDGMANDVLGKAAENSEDFNLYPHLEERAINGHDCLHVDRPCDEGCVDKSIGKASKANENVSTDRSMLESAMKDRPGESVDVKGRSVLEGLDSLNRKMQVSIEKDDGEGRSIGMLGERVPDSRKEENGQRTVSKSEGEKPTLSSGDLAFEDSSDGLEPIQQIEAQCN